MPWPQMVGGGEQACDDRTRSADGRHKYTALTTAGDVTVAPGNPLNDGSIRCRAGDRTCIHADVPLEPAGGSGLEVGVLLSVIVRADLHGRHVLRTLSLRDTVLSSTEQHGVSLA